MDIKILGKTIGTAGGYYELAPGVVMFVLVESTILKNATSLIIDYFTGEVQVRNDFSEETHDALSIVNSL